MVLVQVDGPTPDLVVKRNTLAFNSVFFGLCAFQENPMQSPLCGPLSFHDIHQVGVGSARL